ncbi:DUF2283 domain-containing protein [Nocardioides sp. GY 10127]|uniref:DUF2283 domain-containing protein n=1 Tax=Nocardioides sp. GY 10127 TaxID=2569762 RepID=UPI0010A8D6C5|nr:DUF2283 domain-containing protein [Nocardioides sp. GY 10127]TIC84114.1 DUF2283 domain-containing protein [Nocardioides sp. GY 10127]
MSIKIEWDTAVDAGYIHLSDEPVSRTVEVNVNILVDLDEYGVAVGIEVLDGAVEIPFTELVDRFHVHSKVIDFLRLVRPSPTRFLSLTTGTDGTSNRVTSGSRPFALV